MKALLFMLIFIRMSLDSSSQYFSVSIFEKSITLSQILGIGMAALGLVLIVSKWYVCRRFPLVLPFALLGLWGIATLPFSIAPQATAQELLRIFGLFTVALLAFMNIRTIADFKELLIILFASFLIPITVGLYQYAFGIGFADETVSIPRIFGTFAHPNVFSLTLFSVFFLGILFLSTFAKNEKEKSGSIIFLATSGLALLLTFSRVAWIALFTALSLLALWRYRKALVLLLAIPILLFTFSGTVRDRVVGSFDRTPDSSIAWRMTLWDDMLRKTAIDGKNVTGYGLDTFPIVSEDLRGIALGSNDAHNDFVKFFVEGGYVGLATFLTFLFSILFVLISAFRGARDHRMKIAFGSLLILFSAMEFSALSDNAFKNTPLWWIFFAVLGGALGTLRKQGHSV